MVADKSSKINEFFPTLITKHMFGLPMVLVPVSSA
jgi:hypothetical protein